MIEFSIDEVTSNPHLIQEIEKKINNKTKPLGSLGYLEDLAKQVSLIQNTLKPVLKKPQVLVFAGDHGVANKGVSAYPQEVTYQMVLNFLNGGAAINVFCKQNGLAIRVVDAGVNFDFNNCDGLINKKVAFGTKNFYEEAAMSQAQYHDALQNGGAVIDGVFKEGSNVVGFGEMGIGNTSSAACLMHLLTRIPLEACVGAGAGLDELSVVKKLETLQKAVEKAGEIRDVHQIVQYFGGFEIVQIIGAMLNAAQRKMLLLIDGFIVTAAFLAASKIAPQIKDYAIFTHQSDENGHGAMLEYLEAKPLLDLSLRLGEGTGCALAYPIIVGGVNFLNQMASFEDAGVTSKEQEVV